MKVLLIFLSYILTSTPAWAGGNVMVSWTQEADCEIVDHWELHVNNTLAGSLVDTCGGVLSSVITIVGVGPKAFKLRALTAEGYASDWSNEVTIMIPLGGAPSLVEVNFQPGVK